MKLDLDLDPAELPPRVSGSLLDGGGSEHGAQSRKRKRVSLTTMPMQSKVMQQLMDENSKPVQPKESEAAKILSQNEARSKRYYERIEAGARAGAALNGALWVVCHE